MKAISCTETSSAKNKVEKMLLCSKISRDVSPSRTARTLISITSFQAQSWLSEVRQSMVGTLKSKTTVLLAFHFRLISPKAAMQLERKESFTILKPSDQSQEDNSLHLYQESNLEKYLHRSMQIYYSNSSEVSLQTQKVDSLQPRSREL